MKFDEICEFVLIGEGDYDTLSGKGKIFSLADDAEEKIQAIDLNVVKELIKKTTLPFNVNYIRSLVLEDLADYLPAETPDLKKMLKRNIWAKFDDTEKKSKRAAEVVFAFLKKKKLITPGIKKNELPSDKDIEKLSRELEGGEEDYKSGVTMSDVGKFGGVTSRQTGYPEDESRY